ncbi:DNA repair protein RecN [Candidatus Cyanaurora vandensis]|uniref:DNA repair protein RecN n=1 Tax=Candidatus Cyanaurora vandensis TaxID=2714958 RepID=UPI00257BD65E|nr:DNA repair protein RecN [Candidatus Cyanaurora vandensis]
MLKRLTIENFILVNRLDLHFQQGLTVLTGETGAGKSILLDAVDGVLGGKLTATVIRPGATKATLEATFTTSPALEQWLTQQELDPSDELVISREVSARASRSRVNGVLVNQHIVQQLREILIDFTAQGQTSTLQQPEFQLALLDRFAQSESLLVQVRAHYEDWQQAKTRLNQAQQQQQQDQSQKDLLRQQYQELKQAKVSDPQEEEDLQAEQERLLHTVELTQHGQMVYGLLYRNNPAIQDQLTQVQRYLTAMSTHDPELGPLVELSSQALVQVEECARQVKHYTDQLEADPDRLAQVEQRLRDLKKICQKYGPTLADVIAHQQRIQQQWQQLKGTSPVTQYQTEVDQTLQALQQVCEHLSQRRRQAALQLEQQLGASLAPLGMAKARFLVEFTPTAPRPDGQERINYLLTTNPGQPPAPLKSVASGGEMARFLLALKVTLGAAIPTLIFDEIDVGVSGKVAQAVAVHLLTLARERQVLCVTHQPLVAAMANTHWRVRKTVTNDQTQVSVDALENLGDRTEELAQLAGGHSAQQAREFVVALLEEARQLQACGKLLN